MAGEELAEVAGGWRGWAASVAGGKVVTKGAENSKASPKPLSASLGSTTETICQHKAT